LKKLRQHFTGPGSFRYSIVTVGSGKSTSRRSTRSERDLQFRSVTTNRLPFGLSNSPANFQRQMDLVLNNLIGTDCYVYIVDVILFSKTAEEHAARLENVL